MKKKFTNQQIQEAFRKYLKERKGLSEAPSSWEEKGDTKVNYTYTIDDKGKATKDEAAVSEVGPTKKANKAARKAFDVQMGTDPFTDKPQDPATATKLGRQASREKTSKGKFPDLAVRQKVATTDPKGYAAARKDVLQTKKDIATQGAVGAQVPANVKQAAASGGRVVFGSYYDAAGKYLGKTKGGQWIPAGQGKQKGVLPRENAMELKESKERRFNTLKLTALMEKLLPELTDAQSKKLSALFTEICTMASVMNMTPNTKFNMTEWLVLKTAAVVKLEELKAVAESISTNKKDIDFRPLIKALEEAIVA